MSAVRRYVNQLGERENIDQVFLVADKQLRANRNGNLYLQLRLMDKSGSLTGMLWNANDGMFNSVETGNYLRVAGTTQIYNGQLQMIAFLHDAGKIDELVYEREFGYSDAGQLIGHVVMVLSTLEDKVAESERLAGNKFPEELVLRLKHMVVSHHGEYEFGSPKLPMTLEAIALHLLDNLDAKLYSVAQIMKEDVGSESNWTSYNQALGRKFFKGQSPRP